MEPVDLSKLDAAVKYMVDQGSFASAVARLRDELARTAETFVWETVDLETIPVELPNEIRSAWIFHLRRDVPSGSHRHPNSVQHMTMVGGQGASNVAGEVRQMVRFSSTEGLTNRWLVIGQDVAHEFIPEHEDMTVVSFHTCAADQLEEVECDSGEKRRYEDPGSRG